MKKRIYLLFIPLIIPAITLVYFSEVQFLLAFALIAGILSLGLMGVIWGAGRLACANRTLLLMIFRPGLYLSVIALVVITILQAIMAMVLVYFLEIEILGYVKILHILGIGAGAVFGAVAVIRATIRSLKKTSTPIAGKIISEQHGPTLWTFVKGLAESMGVTPPNHILAGFEPTYFVTEAAICCLNGNIKGRTLYLSVPLCRVLSVEELKAIIYHELGHFKGKDTQYSKRFYPIYKGTAESLFAIKTEIETGSLALYPAYYLLSYFYESFELAERKISRERELAADQISAQMGGPRNFSTALLKIYISAKCWTSFFFLLYDKLFTGERYQNISMMFAELMREDVNESTLEDLDKQKISHPTDSHPPLNERLHAIGASVSEVSDTITLNVPFEAQAISLIDGYEELEEELTGYEYEKLQRFHF